MPNIVEKVETRIEELTNKSELELPNNYSASNALRTAWLKLQEIKDRNGNYVLESCTESSIGDALFKMVTMGLNPFKDQCYFIAYGSKLFCQPGYFGYVKIAKTVGVKEFNFQPIYKGDEVVTGIDEAGREYITKHERPFQNRFQGGDLNSIVAGYVVVVYEDDKPNHTEIMTIEEVKKAWGMGKMYKEGGSSTHTEFPEAMVKKTLLSRAARYVVNTSDDSNLQLDTFRDNEMQIKEELAEQEVEENANMQVIDIDVGVDEEEVTKETPKEEPDENPEISEEDVDKALDEGESKKSKAKPRGNSQMSITDGPDFE